MTDLRKAAERLLEALDDGWVQRDDWVAITLRQALAQSQHPLDIYERAYFAGKQDGIDETEAINKIPTTLCGPNLEQTLNAAGFYRQRIWVGLTDEEIAEGVKQSWVTEQAFQSAVWWAEAKLKEKNNG